MATTHTPGSPPRTGDQDQHRPGVGQAAQTPQQDHTPRQEEQQRREQQGQRRGQGQQAQAPSAEAQAEQKEAQAAASIGAQVILDFNGAGSIGARGGAGGDIVENTAARDEYLVGLGLDPAAPSGPPPEGGAEALRKQQEAAAPRYVPSVSGKATRVSSLAAGLEQGDLPVKPPSSPP